MTRRIGSLAAMILLLAACSSSTPAGGSGGAGATADPTVAFCAAVDTYGQALVKLDAMTPSVTVEEYKKAAADAKAALALLIAVAGPFVGAQLNQAQAAQANLTAAVDQLPANATPAEAEAALDPLIKAVIVELAGLRNALCNTRPTPSSAP